MRNWKITENALMNLLTTYANHRVACERIIEEAESDEELVDLYDDPDYSHHAAYCHSSEEWMGAMGISPESNFVEEILEKERRR